MIAASSPRELLMLWTVLSRVRAVVVASLDRLMEGCWLVALLVTPLIFNPGQAGVFEPIKASIIRRMAEGLVVLVVARVILRWPDKGRLLNAITAAVALTVVVGLEATWFSPYFWLSALGSYERQQGLTTVVALAILFAGIALTAGPAERRRIVTVSILAATLAAIYGLALSRGFRLIFTDQHNSDLGLLLDDGSGRVSSTLGNPQLFGSYLALILPLTIARLWQHVQSLRWPLGLYAGAAVLQVYGVYLSGARGAVLGLGAAVVLVLFRMKHQRIAAGGLLILALGFGGLLLVRPLTNNIRLLIWGASVQAYAAAPVTGYGLDTQPLSLSLVPSTKALASNTAAAVKADGSGILDRAHNAVLDAGLTAGAPGIAAYLLLWGAALVTAWRVSVPLLSALTVHLVDAQVGIESNAILLEVMALMAVLVVIAASKSKENAL